MIPGALAQSTIRKTRGLNWHATNSGNISNSIWLDGSTQDLSRSSFTLSSDGQKELIVSIWVKRLEFGRAQEVWVLGNSSGIASYNDMIHANFNAGDTLTFSVGTGGSSGGAITTTRVFRDIGWYHLLFTFNSNTSVVPATSRIQLYVNGELQTGSVTAVPNNQDVRGSLTGSADFRFGRNTHGSLGYFNNTYMAQACYLEGKSIQAGDFSVSDFLDTTAFGDNGSQFTPKKDSDIVTLANSAGGNSFCLDFADTSAFGNDISSNNNDLTSASMSTANQSVSTPSKTYSVFNPLAHADNSFPGTFTTSEGNSKIVTNSSNVSVKTTLPFIMSGSNIIRTQFTFTTAGHGGCGITSSRHSAGTYHTNAISVAGDGEVVLNQNGSLSVDGTFNNSYFGGLSNGDVVDVIVNCDVGAVYFAVNGTLLGSATQSEIQAGTTTNAALTGGSFVRRKAGEVFNFYAVQFNPTSSTIEYNSGQKSFTHSYSTITSLVSLNTADLPAPEYQGIDYFDSTLYEGNGGGQRVGDFVPYTDPYTVTKSVIFNDDDSDYLVMTPSGAGTSNKIGTISLWVKRANVGEGNLVTAGSSASNYNALTFKSDDKIQFAEDSNNFTFTTTRVFRDSTSWHNIVVAFDTTQSTNTNRVKFYYDGVQLTAFDTETYPAQDFVMNYGTAIEHNIGRLAGVGGTLFDGYLAQVVYIDGTQLTPSSFGQTDTSTNRWVPKDVSGLTFGTNGYYLEFEDSNNLGRDSSVDSVTAPTKTFLSGPETYATAVKTNDATSYTFSSVSFGSAASNRSIVVGIGAGRASSGARSVNSVTIGGVTATIAAEKNSPAGNVAAIAFAKVPTGTSGDIVVTFNSTMARCGIGVWSATDLGGVIDTDGDADNANADLTSTLTGSQGAIAFYHLYDEGAFTSASFSNATERYETVSSAWEGDGGQAGADYTFTSSGSVSVVATLADNGNDGAMIGVAFGRVGENQFVAG